MPWRRLNASGVQFPGAQQLGDGHIGNRGYRSEAWFNHPLFAPRSPRNGFIIACAKKIVNGKFFGALILIFLLQQGNSHTRGVLLCFLFGAAASSAQLLTVKTDRKLVVHLVSGAA